MFEFRPYQNEIADKGVHILRKYGIVYLALQPRTGKSLISLKISEIYGAKNVLFLTKLKAIASIEDDYNKYSPHFKITVRNYESIHKVLLWNFDLIICDEAHGLSGLPKPSMRTKALRDKVWDLPIIYLSATPTAESFSQIFHQFWISKNSPFARYKNFYQWSKDYVNVKKKYINGYDINDYSQAKEAEVKSAISPYMVNLSQEEAGFTSFIEEEVLYIPIDARIYKLMDILKKDRIFKMKCGDTIIAETPAKLQSLYHQLSGGTVKIDDQKSHIIDESKAWFIKTKFAGYKIAIFYQFVKELEILKKIFPENTNSPEEFNKNEHLTFLSQMASGSQGTNLSTADYLIGYNISFSATIYWQFRERMQNLLRTKKSKLYWIFSERGLEKEVHKAVVRKKNFTLNYFRRAYGVV